MDFRGGAVSSYFSVRRQINMDFLRAERMEALADLGFRFRGPSVHFKRLACGDASVEF